MTDLILPVKRKWFDQIQSGDKPFEYRLNNDYWRSRFFNKDGSRKTFDRVIVTLGYPKRNDAERRLIFGWHDWDIQTVVSEEWGNEPQSVFAIVLKASEVEE